jgi:hypothetical protein
MATRSGTRSSSRPPRAACTANQTP